MKASEMRGLSKKSPDWMKARTLCFRPSSWMSSALRNSVAWKSSVRFPGAFS